jgi:hypothetical protein
MTTTDEKPKQSPRMTIARGEAAAALGLWRSIEEPDGGDLLLMVEKLGRALEAVVGAVDSEPAKGFPPATVACTGCGVVDAVDANGYCAACAVYDPEKFPVWKIWAPTPEDKQRVRDIVNLEVTDDSARILLHRTINAYAPRPPVQHPDTVRLAIGNLLAVIHGDGGHHQDAVGLVKACEDAQARVYSERADRTAAIEMLVRCRDAIARSISQVGSVELELLHDDLIGFVPKVSAPAPVKTP